MAKQAYVYSGTEWVPLASEVTNLSSYQLSNGVGLAKVIPTSVAVGSGSGSVDSLGTVTFSGASSVSLNDVFSSTYDHYKIIVVAENSSATWQLLSRLRVSGSDNSSSNYYWSGFYQTFASATPALNTQGSNGLTTSFQIGQTANPAATLANQTIIEIANPFATAETTFNSSGTVYESSPGVSSSNRYAYGGMTSVTTSYTGFTIFPQSANISGSVSVYGYKK